MTQASVILCTFNHLPYVRLTIPSVCCQSMPGSKYDIIVVDDGSSDGTGEFLDEFSRNRNTGITVVHNAANLGLARSRNVGASKAQSDLLIFLDDDNVADFFLVQSYISGAGEFPDDVLQGHQVFPDWILKNNFAKAWASWVVPGNKNLDVNNISAKNVCPGNFAIPKKYFDAVGGFNEKFRYWGLEDGEFTYRLLKQCNAKLRFAEKAKTYHIDEGFTYSVYLRKYASIGRNALPVLREHSPEFVALTNYGYVEDLAAGESISRKLLKIVLHAYFYSPFPFLLEKILLLVDDIPWLHFFRRFYKLGLSYAVWKGYRQGKKGSGQHSQWF